MVTLMTFQSEVANDRSLHPSRVSACSSLFSFLPFFFPVDAVDAYDKEK